jgi:hypothetical protein
MLTAQAAKARIGSGLSAASWTDDTQRLAALFAESGIVFVGMIADRADHIASPMVVFGPYDPPA